MKKVTRKKKRGLLVTFEGIDGCGKTTQIHLAAKHLSNEGRQVRVIREPGSTSISERIRKLLLDKQIEMNGTTELFLYEAARAELVASIIRPGIEGGEIILLDRFYDSTTAYQAYGRKLDVKMVKRLNKVAVGDCIPDLTIIFDLSVAQAIKRRTGKPDRLESQSKAFHQRVRDGYKKIAASEPRRVKLVDATRTVDQVFSDVRRMLERKLSQ